MREYQAYVLDADGHIQKRFDFEAPDDDGALQHARRYVDGHDVELWNLDRIVGKLAHPPGADYAMLAASYRERAKIERGDEAERLTRLAEQYERMAKPGSP